jgi:hypothetical protein
VASFQRPVGESETNQACPHNPRDYLVCKELKGGLETKEEKKELYFK